MLNVSIASPTKSTGSEPFNKFEDKSKQSTICFLHFKPENFDINGNLKKDAFPTVFNNEPIRNETFDVFEGFVNCLQ